MNAHLAWLVTSDELRALCGAVIGDGAAARLVNRAGACLVTAGPFNGRDGEASRICVDDFHAALVDVTCEGCRAVVRVIGAAHGAARRGGEVPWLSAGRSGYPRAVPTPAAPGTKVLEELGINGQWKRFDVLSWLDEQVGQYTPTIRVRRRS